MTTCHPIDSLWNRKPKSVERRIAIPTAKEEKVRIPSKTLILATGFEAHSFDIMPMRVTGREQISSVTLRVSRRSDGSEWNHWGMPRYGYLVMLLFTMAGSWWLEWAFKLRVLRRIGFTLMTILPISAFFVLWDWIAIHSGHWDFDYSQTLGLELAFGLPLEEYLFFIIIPLAIILTYEGVTRLKPKWRDRHHDERAS